MPVDAIRLQELRAAVADADACVSAVSAWSAGMHVHHCCLGMIGICKALAASRPPPPRSRFSLVTALVFLTGRIPRGRGRAPDAAAPRRDVSPAELSTFLDESVRLLAATNELDRGAWFKHGVFGVLDRDKAIRFMRIHNRHHLKIIADIVAG
jgi:hypothetical protein